MFLEHIISLCSNIPWPAYLPDLSACWLFPLWIPVGKSVLHWTTGHQWPQDHNLEANFSDTRKHGEVSTGKPASKVGRVCMQW
jgi:hypothetical protein